MMNLHTFWHHQPTLPAYKFNTLEESILTGVARSVRKYNHYNRFKNSRITGVHTMKVSDMQAPFGIINNTGVVNIDKNAIKKFKHVNANKKLYPNTYRFHVEYARHPDRDGQTDTYDVVITNNDKIIVINNLWNASSKKSGKLMFNF